jgi:hypothetical protein
MECENPSSASFSETVINVNKSFPLRVNMACGFCFSDSTTLPGSCPGRCSLARAKDCFAPLSMPRSTSKVMSLFSFLHRSSEATSCFWFTTKPGASWRCTT